MPELSKEYIQQIKQITPVVIGKRIRQIREQKGVTQTQLANWTESDRQYIYKIETAKVGISVSKLAVIARALDVKLTDLVAID